jgi:hypothetical protein
MIQIPCTVCGKECLNKGWHLAKGNFCSVECMSNYIDNINILLDKTEELEEKMNELEKKIKKQEEKYARRR